VSRARKAGAGFVQVSRTHADIAQGEAQGPRFRSVGIADRAKRPLTGVQLGMPQLMVVELLLLHTTSSRVLLLMWRVLLRMGTQCGGVDVPAWRLHC
jgi:hypothetical protein